MARSTFWLVFTSAVLAVGVGAYLYLPETTSTPAPPANAAMPRQAPRVSVEVQRVAVETIIEDIRAVGTLRPNESVVVAPEITGRIARIRFSEGQAVSAGDVLVELDSSILKAELAKARSDLALTRANNERAITLARQGTGTLRARDEAQAAFLAAQANLALAEARLQKATISAPLTGTVGLRAVSVGAYVTPGERIVELSDIDPLKVDFRVPELQVASLRPGQTIRISVDAIPKDTFEGSIYAIDPLLDINGRAIRLRARVPNPDGRLSAGLFVRIQIIIDRRLNSVTIPESAVLTESGKTYVYRVVDGRARRVDVTLGQRRPGFVEIRTGLGPDDTVVTAGHQRLRNGATVEIVRPKTSA